MTDRPTQQVFVVADLSMMDDAGQQSITTLARFGDHAKVGDVDTTVSVPVDQDDADSIRQLVFDGHALLVNTHMDARAFADRLGTRQYYFHPATGKLGSYQLAIPMIMTFFLMHADPGLAAHLMTPGDHIIARGYQETVFRFDRTAEALTAQILTPRVPDALHQELVVPVDLQQAPPSDIASADWVVHSCALTDVAEATESYTNFPELTPEFVAAFETFQRRLCVRQLAKQEAEFLRQPLVPTVETALLDMARRCGYWDDTPFSSFAYSFLILGQEGLSDSPNFRCDADQHPARALFNIEMPRIDATNRKRNIARYGAGWDK
ncbi:hypothetical protein [Yoonia sp. SS1-5]|uniref:Uncharacterized protein n=1 Tax=Yoonia rhodophyticola TaxID=3137370 RepID=A0AAN0MIJ7_9RHOB